MSRVYFLVRDFPKFNSYAINMWRSELKSIGVDWEVIFSTAGYKSYQFDGYDGFIHKKRHSLSEEEYTWFVLRFS